MRRSCSRALAGGARPRRVDPMLCVENCIKCSRNRVVTRTALCLRALMIECGVKCRKRALLRARLIEWKVSGGHSFKPDKQAIATKDRQQRPAGHLPLAELFDPDFAFSSTCSGRQATLIRSITANSRARLAASLTCAALFSRSPSTLFTFHLDWPSSITCSDNSSALSASARSKAAASRVGRSHSSAEIQPLGAFAGGDHQIATRSARAPRHLLCRASIEARQVAGTIIGVEIELHAFLVIFYRRSEGSPLFRFRGRGFGETFVAAAHQAKALRRRPATWISVSSSPIA